MHLEVRGDRAKKMVELTVSVLCVLKEPSSYICSSSMSSDDNGHKAKNKSHIHVRLKSLNSHCLGTNLHWVYTALEIIARLTPCWPYENEAKEWWSGL